MERRIDRVTCSPAKKPTVEAPPPSSLQLPSGAGRSGSACSSHPRPNSSSGMPTSLTRATRASSSSTPTPCGAVGSTASPSQERAFRFGCWPGRLTPPPASAPLRPEGRGRSSFRQKWNLLRLGSAPPNSFLPTLTMCGGRDRQGKVLVFSPRSPRTEAGDLTSISPQCPSSTDIQRELGSGRRDSPRVARARRTTVVRGRDAVVAAHSLAYVRGFRKGYKLAARTAGRTPTHLLLSWLVNLMLAWTVTVLLLWFAADIFARNATGEPVTKVVIDRYKAWNTVHD